MNRKLITLAILSAVLAVLLSGCDKPSFAQQQYNFDENMAMANIAEKISDRYSDSCDKYMKIGRHQMSLALLKKAESFNDTSLKYIQIALFISNHTKLPK